MTKDPEPRIVTGRALLGAAIRARREEVQLTRGELAQRAGLSPTTVHHIEIGRRLPSLDSLDALALGMNTTARSLLRGVFPWDGGSAEPENAREPKNPPADG